MGAAVYADGQPSFVAHEEGRTVPDNGGGWRYEYFLKDHLGNTRAVMAGTLIPGSADVLQTTSYYPFGLTMAQTDHNTVLPNYRENRYLYNGKELQGDGFGGAELGWYDYGARFYDAQLGKFHTIDDYCEFLDNYTPYNYAINNPIYFIDYNGENPVAVVAAGIGIVEVGLLSTGVISTGIILQKTSYGHYELTPGIKQLFSPLRKYGLYAKHAFLVGYYSFAKDNRHGKLGKVRNYRQGARMNRPKGKEGNKPYKLPEGWEYVGGAAVGTQAVVHAVRLYVTNKESVTPGQPEFKTSNLNEFYPDNNFDILKSIIEREIDGEGGSDSRLTPSSNNKPREIDPTLVPEPAPVAPLNPNYRPRTLVIDPEPEPPLPEQPRDLPDLRPGNDK
ncbi:MAG: RHS repeat-associated core domain-containing protein [Breznakibacter sp.]